MIKETVVKGAQPLAQDPPKHLSDGPAHIEGTPVDLGDCAKAIYRDPAGSARGRAPSEGSYYRGTVEANAIQSVIDAEARETAKV